MKGWRILRSQFLRSMAFNCERAVPISAKLERERERERECVCVWLYVFVKGKYGMCGNEKREGSGKRKKRLYSFLEFDGTLWLGTPPTTFLFLFQFFSCYSFFFFLIHFYRKWNLNFEFWISFLFKMWRMLIELYKT